MSRTITAMFNSRSEAEAAASKLRSEIGTEARIVDQSSSSSGSSSSEGSGSGFWADLKEMFVADEDRGGYEEGVRRGHFLLTANVPEDQASRACSLLDQSGPVDFDRSQDEWRNEGWTGQGSSGQYSSSLGSSSQGSSGSAMFSNENSNGNFGDGNQSQQSNIVEEEHIPVFEEQLRIGKREIERGGARVRSYVEERPVHETVNLREEHVHVERRPVDQSLTSDNLDNDLLRERNIEMHETAEEAVIGKDARMIEEVIVQKTADQRTQEIDDTVRKTHFEVDEGAQGSDFGDRR